ncbi:hypothetical protein BC938DRAFT_480103 [Jimgerdemannia flammicorona]|uniref:THIF-type NAD/FAD binding fold domain-containing protein n=1 Tax=Jimgerdemannia flammicorona TaxID=994334 RepID=A0A433QJD6_9FUNG|nr:hypothetical protein BC938DRAFT_480103 [Jimgerdemannia flammicorona]
MTCRYWSRCPGLRRRQNFVGIGVGRKSLNGRILYFDDDYVSHSNLTRQFRFTEDDAKRRSPKATTLVKFMTHRRPDISMEAPKLGLVLVVTRSSIRPMLLSCHQTRS